MFGALSAIGALSPEDRLRWANRLKHVGDPIPERDRCVNCDDRAGDNGWCPDCWSEIAPT